ncbi:MAG: methenyltetrahydromethanopterin cyclohydrolase [Thermoplasmata archaeon]|nr:MAG: methenyltetrahydromethanopterin cyclohydrolase [Thermoplasmata archaeon]
MAMPLNERVIKIIDELLKKEEEYGISHLKIGEANIIDCGVKSQGSVKAGELFSKVCLGGKGEVKVRIGEYAGLFLPFVEVVTDSPIFCFMCQKADWNIGIGMASGPGKLLKDKKEKAEKAVVTIETNEYPSEETVEEISRCCNVEKKDLYILLARTSSIVGRIQIAARSVETALYKLEHIGEDIKVINYAWGVCPVAPLLGDDLTMLGITNDLMIYTSRVFLSSSKSLDVERIPSSSSTYYGKSFLEILKEVDFDFYKVPQDIFAPAEVWINDEEKRKMVVAGKVDMEKLRSLFISQSFNGI